MFVDVQNFQLCSYGVDLCYQLDGSLRTPLTRALKESRDKLIEVIKRKTAENKWIPMNLRTKTGLSRCLLEHSDMGLNLENYVTGDCWLQLSSNTVGFIKLYLSLVNDCLKLKTSDLLHLIDEILYDTLETQINYIEHSLRNETQSEQRTFIVKNANFLLTALLDLVQRNYEEAVGFKCGNLERLAEERVALTKGISPSARSVAKYSSGEYL